VFAALDGDNASGQLFVESGPCTPVESGAYAIGYLFKSGAGFFYGAAGQYKGTANVWVMAFDRTTPPTNGTNTNVLIATSSTIRFGSRRELGFLTGASVYTQQWALHSDFNDWGGVYRNDQY
jgi:hypothetical protein